jgi:hypothetical protein
MPAIGRRRPQRADRDDDPQPCVGAFGIAFLTHPFDHLSRHSGGVLAVLRDPLMSSAADVEIGDGHGATIARPARSMKHVIVRL